MRVLLIGSRGAIGQAAAASLVRSGFYVVGASRSTPTSPHESEHVTVDRNDVSGILDVVRNRRVDTVIDLIAWTAGTTRPLLDRLDGVVGRYVLISSCDVYRNYELLQRKDRGEALLGEADEGSALRRTRFPYRGESERSVGDPSHWMDGYDKIPIEEDVQRLKSDWTILRLPMVFGPGDKQRRFRWAIAPMLAKQESISIPAAWLNWTTTYGYIDNVGAAIALAAHHPNAAREIFNVGDTPPVDHAAWIERFRGAIGWTGDVHDDRDRTSPLANATASLDLTVPLKVSFSKLHSSLGFRPTVAVKATIEATITDEEQRGA
jgi:nucleoside-diphosphate-sugar epimerase